MIYDKARELSKMLAESEEYKTYKQMQEKAFANETTKAMRFRFRSVRQAGARCPSGHTV